MSVKKNKKELPCPLCGEENEYLNLGDRCHCIKCGAQLIIDNFKIKTDNEFAPNELIYWREVSLY